jgi:CheY-like chemotaxis protein
MPAWGEILIVDDSSTSRMIIQRCIEMAGITATSFRFAENGLDALASLKEKGGVSVIVTDINMPKMDGQTFVRLLKSDPATSSIPAIVVSSIVSGEMDAELLAQGAAAVVKKPVSPAKMASAFGGLI